MSGGNGKLVGENGKEIKTEEEEKPEERLGVLKTADGKEHKVVDIVTVIELQVVKLENGKEVTQVKCRQDLMVKHKRYIVSMLTEAINVVMMAQGDGTLITKATKAMFNKMMNRNPRIKDRFRGKR